jgi:dimethyladenosine transferase
VPGAGEAPYSYLANVRETRATLARFGLVTKHRLGQNFLVSDAVVGKILGLAELVGDDVVLEVGPGIGTLTVALLARAREVIAIEADRALEPVLATTCAQGAERLTLLWGDALRLVPLVPSAVAAPIGSPSPPSSLSGVAPVPNKLVSNLPYQVAATLILKLLQELPSVGRLVVMVQAEVADRICAGPGSRVYGAYTAKLALWGQVTGRFEVGRGSFLPPPHVDSTVVRIDRAPMADPKTGLDLTPSQLDWVAHVIDASFAQRRKTIRNSLSAGGFERSRLDEAFARSDIAPTTRAESLSPSDFVRLADAL